MLLYRTRAVLGIVLAAVFLTFVTLGTAIFVAAPPAEPENQIPWLLLFWAASGCAFARSWFLRIEVYERELLIVSWFRSYRFASSRVVSVSEATYSGALNGGDPFDWEFLLWVPRFEIADRNMPIQPAGLVSFHPAVMRRTRAIRHALGLPERELSAAAPKHL